MKLINKIKNLTKYGPPAAAAAAAASGITGSSAGATAGSTAAGTALGGIGLATNIAAMIANTVQRYKEREQNQENWERTFEYQKKLNDILMAREDTAIQRRAADLKAAGINPLLAGFEGASAMSGSVINPIHQNSIPIDASGINTAIQGIQSNLNEYANREFSAAENEKNRKLEEQKIDIERFNAETSRLQEENSKALNAINERLKDRELDQKDREILNDQKNFYENLSEQSRQFAEGIAVQKRQAKTAEDRQAMDALNSEMQRSLTVMQKLAINNEMSNEDKRLAIEQEEAKLREKFRKSDNHREWMNSIWGNINNTMNTITKVLPWSKKDKK